MATVTQDKYSPYPRCCDVCGQLRSIATMTKLDSVTWVCDKHTGERTRIMLDVLNAHARPPQTWPVKNPRPQDPQYPNTLDYDEGACFAFIDRQIQAQCRYEIIESGAGPYTAGGDAVPALAWAARYLYGLIVENKRTLLIARAKVLLTSCASFLLSRQYGSATGPLSSATQANNAFYGGVIESGATVFKTDDVAAAGLALLYAYRVFGTLTYLFGARAAASYLRNVQAIGSNGSQHTSSDAAGTSRLYTGSVCSQVTTQFGIDPGQNFYSNHLFYPSGLIALELWNELLKTDGDQTVGATTAVNGFDTTPSQLLSQSIADIRACWNNGIRDATGTLLNGLSSTTPREDFNAYPAVKFGFTSVGTGMWEFSDGGASNGTQITSQNFARALSSLFAYEGATSQVTTVFNWLRAFTSNSTFETPANTSGLTLARTTTGTYDPTLTLSTALTVRDAANSYAAAAVNGSSVYDWGAFGVMASLLANVNKTSFMNSRLGPVNLRQRYDDGTPNDAIYDRIDTRGISGLTYQTGFRTYTSAFGSFDKIETSPDMNGLKFWIQSDLGITLGAGNKVTNAVDQTNNGWDFYEPNGTDPRHAPIWRANRLGTIPSIYYDDNDDALAHYGAPGNRTNAPSFPAGTPYGPFGQVEPNIVIAVVKPDLADGGMVYADRTYFSRQLWNVSGIATTQRVARTTGGVANSLLQTPNVSYVGTLLLIVWRWDGANMYVTVNGNPLVTYDFFNPTTLSAKLDPVMDAQAGWSSWLGSSAADQVGFRGDMFAWFGYSGTTVPTKTLSYLAGKYAGVTGYITNDALLSSQYSLSFRGAH